MSKKPKKSTVFKHFTKSDEEGKLICRIQDGEKICYEKVSTKASNMKRHEDKKHPDIGKEISAADNAAKREGVSQVSASSKESKQAPISSFFSSEKITVFMTKEKLEQYIIEMLLKMIFLLAFFLQRISRFKW